MFSKESIIETYKQLVIQNKTSKITVKEICETMHISRTTFYKYFKDSYHIMETICSSIEGSFIFLSSASKITLDRIVAVIGSSSKNGR